MQQDHIIEHLEAALGRLVPTHVPEEVTSGSLDVLSDHRTGSDPLARCEKEGEKTNKQTKSMFSKKQVRKFSEKPSKTPQHWQNVVKRVALTHGKHL